MFLIKYGLQASYDASHPLLGLRKALLVNVFLSSLNRTYTTHCLHDNTFCA